MQPVSSRIWTRVAVSSSYDDNHYNTGTSLCLLIVAKIPWEKHNHIFVFLVNLVHLLAFSKDKL